MIAAIEKGLRALPYVGLGVLVVLGAALVVAGLVVMVVLAVGALAVEVIGE